jgi:hypothetical protein
MAPTWLAIIDGHILRFVTFFKRALVIKKPTVCVLVGLFIETVRGHA